MASIEQDIDLKLQTMRYLWHLGYVTRKDIDLVEYGFERDRVYTDIDVLGIKLDENFQSFFISCDCKSGIRVKTAERLFWLSGVMKYFDAKEGLFIRTSSIEPKYIGLSKRLGIAPLSSNQLTELEKTYNVPPRFLGPFCQEQKNIDSLFTDLKKVNLFAHDYILKKYWKDEPQQQIVTLISICQKIKEQKELEEFKQFFVLAYCLSLLSISILRLSRPILAIPPEHRENVAKYELLGGEEALLEKKALMEDFYNFMVNEISKRYSEKYPVPKTQFLENLLPQYSKHFADIVMRFCQNPSSSILVPRILDLFSFEFVLNNRTIELKDVISMGWNRFSLKPFKDFMVFASRSNLITTKFEESVKEFITTLESEPLK
jgi:hypothetical protein